MSAPTDSSAPSVSADQDNQAPSSPAQDFELSTFEATDPAEEDLWAAIPAERGRSRAARNALRYTSIDDQEPPRAIAPPGSRNETPAERAQAQRAIQEELEEERREDEEEREQAANDVQRARDERADATAEDLRQHYIAQQPLIDVYESCRRRYAEEDPTGSAAFEVHAANVVVVTRENVLFYSLLLWFQNAPHYLQLSLRSLIRSYQQESRLRVELNKWERAVGETGGRVTQAQQVAAAGIAAAEAGVLVEALGMETDPDMHRDSIGGFMPRHFEDDEHEEKWIRALYEVRKVRLEQEMSPSLKRPMCVPFERSLDFSVKEFCRKVREHYIDGNGQPRRHLSVTFDALLTEMQTYAAALV